MRTWERATRNRWCGFCRTLVPKGQPIQFVKLETAEKVRCPICADECPPELPPLPEKPQPVPTPIAKPEAVAEFDWKAKQSGND